MNTNTILIEYYTKDIYGNTLEYVKNPITAQHIRLLTGQKTINSNIRGLLQTISRGTITFKQVLS